MFSALNSLPFDGLGNALPAKFCHALLSSLLFLHLHLHPHLHPLTPSHFFSCSSLFLHSFSVCFLTMVLPFFLKQSDFFTNGLLHSLLLHHQLWID